MCSSVQKSLDDVFFLKWHSFLQHHEINKLRDEEELCDITFACQGKKLQAHKLVLFACSPYFKEILKDNPSPHPIFFMNDVKFEVLKAILEYMYLGEVHITNDNLKEFIKIAEGLQIRGLSNENNENMLLTSSSHNTIDSNVNLLEEYCKKRTMNTDTDTSETVAKKTKSNDSNTTELSIEPKVEMEFKETSEKNEQTSVYCNYNEKNIERTSPMPFEEQHTTAIIHDYKSEDDWIEKSFDSVSVSSENQLKVKCKNSPMKINLEDKANCLTPRCCPVCSRLYSNVSNLRQHMKLIHNPQAVICPICQKHFNSELYLKRHYSSIHSINIETHVDKVQHTQQTEATNDYQPRENTSAQQTTTWNPYDNCQIVR